MFLLRSSGISLLPMKPVAPAINTLSFGLSEKSFINKVYHNFENIDQENLSFVSLLFCQLDRAHSQGNY